MDYNPRIISINNLAVVHKELSKIGCDQTGINIMSPKAVFKKIKLENIPAKAANLLKQTFLAKGGEVAVTRGTADLSVEYTDVLICATLKQYKLALAQLKSQPWGLPKVAQAIDTALEADDTFPVRRYSWTNQKLSITPGRTLIMGILNITPDSFSDGGKFNTLDAAVRRVEEMIEEGADIIDIGAESTRPYGAQEISAEEEMERLLPVLEKILPVCSVPVSIDTYKAKVANEALKLGAHIINDVWGLQKDPDMANVAAQYNVPVVVMHNRTDTIYERDIMSEICAFLRHSIHIGTASGIERKNIIIDPGIGFGKTPAQNLEIMPKLHELKTIGCPILLGTSRKRFIGEVLNLEVAERLEGTAATVALGIAQGVNIIRVHDVKAMSRVAKMTDSITGGNLL